MGRIGRILLSLLLLALVVELLLIAPSDIANDDSGPRASSAETSNDEAYDGVDALRGQNGVNQAMKNVHLVRTREGQKEWELWAEEALSYTQQELWDLQEVKAIFFGENGVDFTVTGDQGSVELESKNMKVDGHVVTKSSNGYVFKTDSVSYDSQTRLLRSPSEVNMRGPKDGHGNSLQLTGKQLHANLADSLMEVQKDVWARKTLTDGRKMTIRSEKARFSGEKRMAHFVGNVVMDYESMRITGPEANFLYHSEKETLKSVHIRGGAKVSDLDKWATADDVKVLFEQNEFVFRGKPRVVQNNDELRGEEIIFLDGGKKVKVKGARARVDKERMERVN